MRQRPMILSVILFPSLALCACGGKTIQTRFIRLERTSPHEYP